MKYIKYILLVFLIVGLSLPYSSFAGNEDGKKSSRRSTVFSKQGKFKKDVTFNKNGTKSFGPPDPGDGDGGYPVPVNPAYGLMMLSGLGFALYLYKRKKNS